MNLRRQFIAAIAASAVFPFAASAAKVSSVSIKTVDGIAGDVSDILSQCTVKAGSQFDADACRRDVRALVDSQRYERVSVETADTADGVEVVYVVQRKFRFKGPIVVRGAKAFSESKIASIAKFKDGALIGPADIEAVRGFIEREYRKKFYPDVKVGVVIVPAEGGAGAATVEIDVSEGARIDFGEFVFMGNESIPADELRATFGEYPWYNPLGWFNNTPADDAELDAAAKSVAALYRKKGFLDVVVPRPARKDRGDGKTDFVFSVVEGPQYKVGAITFKGVTNLEERVETKSGERTVESLLRAGAEKAMQEEWTYDEAKTRVAGSEVLSKAEKGVEMYYGARGFVDTEVAVKRIPSESDPGTLDLEFDVKPGRPGIIREIAIRGNDVTKDKVIRREIRPVSPGEPYNEYNAERSRKRVESLGYFSRVQMRLEKPAGTDPEKESLKPYVMRDLVYEVAEQSTGQFGIGVGASSVDSVFGYVEISESNFDLFKPWRFAGGGQKARVNVSAGPRIQTYEASITEPWFLDRPLELTVEGYRRLRWYDQYDVARSGFSASISYPVKFWPTWEAFGRIGFRYSLEYIQMYDVDDGQWGSVKGFDPADADYDTRMYKIEEKRFDESVESVFRLFWADNTLDHPYFPKNGYSAYLFGDVSVGDNEYWRLGATFRQYFTVVKKWNHVFSWRVHAETIDDISDDVPIYNRLFLGGPRSIRGVDYREIAPKVYRKEDHAPWGGKAAFNATAEYTVPLVEYIRLAAFTDVGAVGKDTFDPEFSDICWSVGLGIRLDIPKFPVRLDFAAPVKKPKDVDREIFSFSVGYDF